jgi:hypothetical protein
MAVASASAMAATSLYSNEFSANDGGFTVGSMGTMQPSDQPWQWSAVTGTWATDGPSGTDGYPPRASVLMSPVIPVTDNGAVYMAFMHRYAFEWGPPPAEGPWTFWDGGQLRLSVNGGPMEVVNDGSFVQYGYNSTINPGPGNNFLDGQRGFGASSPGYYANQLIGTVVNLGNWTPGTTLQVGWVASWDWYVAATSPNWELSSVMVAQVPEPATIVTLGLGAIALLARGYRTRRD